MKWTEILGIAWTALRANKLRSMLTMLGIVIAVWTIVSVLAVIGGMDAYVTDTVLTLSPDVFIVTRFGLITSVDEFLEAVKRKEISDRDIERLRQLCKSCGEIGVNLNGTLPVRAAGRRIPDVTVLGTTANVAALLNLDLEAGRYFTEFENEHSRAVAIIGSEVRDELFPRVDPIGRQIWLGQEKYRVIGVKAKQGSILGQNQDITVYFPYRRAAKQFGSQRGKRLDVQMELFVRAAGGVAEVRATQGEVVQIFRWLRHTPFKGFDPVGIVDSEMVQKLWRQISFATFAMVAGIAGVSLFVGAIVVANIMIVSVVERTREIGLRLALGARKRDIKRQFLAEAALLALAGGVVGAGLGSLTAWAIDQNAPVPAKVSGALIAGAMLLAAVTGLLAGYFPARQAANLSPIEALHSD